MDQADQQMWLTPEEAAKILRISVWTIWKALERGDFDQYGARRIGRNWRIPRAAVIPTTEARSNGG